MDSTADAAAGDDEASLPQQQKRLSFCSSTLYGTEESTKDLESICEDFSSGSSQELDVEELRRRVMAAAAAVHHAKEHEVAESHDLGESAVLKEMELRLHEAQVAAARDLLVQRGQLSKESTRLKRKLQISQQRGEHTEYHKQAIRCNVRTMRSLSSLLWKLKGKPCLDPDQAEGVGEGLSEELEKLLVASLGASPKASEERPRQPEASDQSGPVADAAGFKLSQPGERGPGGAVASTGEAADFDELGIIRMIIGENVAMRRKNEALQEALESQKKVVQDQSEQIAQMQGRYESKIRRLTEQLETSKREHAETQEELENLRDSTEAWSSEGLRERLELLESQVNSGMACPCPSVSTERSVAHEQAAAEECEYPADWSDDEGDDLKSKLRRVEQERNVLLNTLEWKEIQWKAQIENMERDMDMQRRHSLQSDVARCASEPPQPAAQPPCPKGSRLSSVMGLLRPFCPARSLSIPWISAGPEPAFCQDTCWRVLNAVSGAVMFRCSVDGDFTILESSQEAGRIWGSANLEGNSVFSLARAQSATWLRCAFKNLEEAAAANEAEVASGNGPSGFLPRDLGRESFIDKRGLSVDYTVKAIRFPAEAACGKEPVFMMILEPEAPSESASQRFSSSGSTSEGAKSKRSPVCRRSRSARSRSSDTSSVTPSDSASNIYIAKAPEAPAPWPPEHLHGLSRRRTPSASPPREV